MSNPAIFIDRDGTINRAPPPHQYILSWDQFHFLPGVHLAFHLLRDSPYKVIIVTNQACVGKGLLSPRDLYALHEKMLDELRWHGRVDAVYVCPHTEEDDCDCRKPRPGMFRRAEIEMDIDLRESWMIGDSLSDTLAAKNAGLRSILVNCQKIQLIKDRTLLVAVNHILTQDAMFEAVNERLGGE